MSVYLFMRLDFASGIGLGPSRVAILEGIDRFGSISGSARAVGLTYRQVWSTVKLLNETFPEPLVDIRVGGPQSGASLTSLGKRIVKCFREMEGVADSALRSHFKAFERMLGEDTTAPAPVPRFAQLVDDSGAEPKKTAATKRARRVG